jgi:hypothetical protein
MPTITPNKALDDERRVREIRVVTYTRGSSGPQTSENHWAILLVLGAALSIRIDMTAEFPDPTGHLKWNLQEYVQSWHQLRAWSWAPPMAFRVCDVARLIYDRGRHRFKMSGGGSGCRFWVSVLPQALSRLT